MLRPQACRWFELVTSRDDLAALLAALARTGAVELQTHEGRAAPLVIEGAAHGLERFHELARTHGDRWPAARSAGAVRITDPAAVLAARLAQIEAWRVEADPLIADGERLAAQRRTLADLAALLGADPALLPEPGLLATAGRFLVDARVYAVASHGSASELSAELLRQHIPGGAQDFVLVVGRREQMAAVDEHFAARKARRVAWPADLRGSVAQAARDVAARQAALEQRLSELDGRMQALAERHDLCAALSDIDVVEWLIRNGSELAASERLVWVTGWTPADDEGVFCAPLQREGLRCVVQFSAPPAGSEPPSLLANPPWVRAFEAFAHMLGQPGRDEADPSTLVAVIAPLLFGFMFGDVGQGAVLCIAGWLLRKRAPMLVLLIPGGAMAIVFGLLFGSVFAREDLIPALWMHPLHDPVALLVAAIALGAAILLGGLALNALQAHWRGAARQWWARDAGLALAYASLLAAAMRPAALWLALAGALWFVAGSAGTASSARFAALVGGLAQFVEQALQIVVNTVSFARVGAFALAHAGLSVAVIGIAEASGGIGYSIVLLLGNALILVLEGLVVGIQTTRLLLFEFFVRFLKGGGRAFRPLPPPLASSVPASGSPP